MKDYKVKLKFHVNWTDASSSPGSIRGILSQENLTSIIDGYLEQYGASVVIPEVQPSSAEWELAAKEAGVELNRLSEEIIRLRGELRTVSDDYVMATGETHPVIAEE